MNIENIGNIDDYTITIEQDDGSFVASIDTIPSCHAWGLTEQNARKNLAEVFEMIKEEQQKQDNH